MGRDNARAKMIRTAISVMVLVSFLGAATACYGPFNLTRVLYKWNGGIKGSTPTETKWVREGVFLLLVLFPIYEFAMLADAILFNSIEFWGGENPIKVSRDGQDGSNVVVHIGDVQAVMAVNADGNSARVVYFKAGEVIRSMEIVQGEDGYRMLDENGRQLYSAEMNLKGGISIVDADCRVIREVPGEQLALNANRLAGAQVAVN